MNRSLEEDISQAIEKYGDMVRRIVFLYFKERSDVEDLFQEVFPQYFLNIGKFKDESHKKSWLCKVTFNKCKDLAKSYWRRNVVGIDIMEIPYESREQEEVLEAVLKLPGNYKDIIYMHYYEGMTIPEIAEILGANVNSVYTRLRRARGKLKKELGDKYEE